MTLSLMPRFHIACLLFLGVILLAGCQRRDVSTRSRFEDPRSEYVLALVLDLSGSTATLFNEDQPGYEFMMKLIDHYMRSVPGDGGTLILLQVSGNDNPLLWEGSPIQLQQDFSDANAFREMLLAKSQPSGSRVNEGLAKTLKYLLKHRSIQHGAKPGIFVLSDMEDNGPSGSKYEAEVLESLKDFGRRGGITGLYFVDQTLVEKWEKHFRDAALRDFRVTPDFVVHPPLPSFD